MSDSVIYRLAGAADAATLGSLASAFRRYLQQDTRAILPCANRWCVSWVISTQSLFWPKQTARHSGTCNCATTNQHGSADVRRNWKTCSLSTRRAATGSANACSSSRPAGVGHEIGAGKRQGLSRLSTALLS